MPTYKKNDKFDSLKTSFSNRITRTIKMKDAKIQKPLIDPLFHGTKVAKLVSCLRFEFNIDFLHQGVSFRFPKGTFFKCEITTIIVGNFKSILSVNVTKEKRF